MRRILGREAAARAAAGRHRQIHDIEPSRDSRVTKEQDFWYALALFIEQQTGSYPRLSRMRTRDVNQWCVRYHEHQREMKRVIRPEEMPVYGKMWRYLYEGEPW